MINDLVLNSLYGEIILAFVLFYWLVLRIMQRKVQKREKWNNMEFWVYYNLIDFYKFNGYPYPEMKAKEELNYIIIKKNEECLIITD